VLLKGSRSGRLALRCRPETDVVLVGLGPMGVRAFRSRGVTDVDPLFEVDPSALPLVGTLSRPSCGASGTRKFSSALSSSSSCAASCSLLGISAREPTKGDTKRAGWWSSLSFFDVAAVVLRAAEVV